MSRWGEKSNPQPCELRDRNFCKMLVKEEKIEQKIEQEVETNVWEKEKEPRGKAKGALMTKQTQPFRKFYAGRKAPRFGCFFGLQGKTKK